MLDFGHILNRKKKQSKHGTAEPERRSKMAEYIDRELLQVRLNRKKAGPANQRYTEGWNDAIMMVKSMVHSAPAADASAVQHGRWNSVKNPQWPAYSHDKCSVCGWWNTKNSLCYDGKPKHGHSLNYCPNCGAKMDLEEPPERLKTCGNCAHFMGFGDFDLCCKIQKRRLCYENEASCEAFKEKEDKP